MNTKVTKLLSVFLIVLFLINPLAILAQEVPPLDPTPTPTSSDIQEPTPTPTIVVEPQATDEATLEDSQAVENENTDTLTITSPNSPSTINTGNSVDINTSENTTNALIINNDNDINATRIVDSQQITGENTANENITLAGQTTIITGEVVDNHNLETVVNTNVVGRAGDVVIMNVYEPSGQDIDLATIRVCEDPTALHTPEVLNQANTGNSVSLLDSNTTLESVAIQNNNNATIENNVTVLANTGDNEAIKNVGTVEIETGDASVGLNLFTMANTNIVGNCFFFGVFNLFASQTGDIVLPYELDIMKQPYTFTRAQNTANLVNTGDTVIATNSANLTTFLGVQNDNVATVDSSIITNTDTGNNTINDSITFGDGPTIATGNATSSVNIIDIINSNIFGDGFILLKINRVANWFGKIIGFTGEIYETDDYILLFSQPISSLFAADEQPSSTLNTGDDVELTQSLDTISDFRVVNNNTALVQNTIDATAKTGGNSAGRFNPSITTGNASITANILNLINTNIVGNNWYFGVINIFDDFYGDVVFARPDLKVTKTAHRHDITKGDLVFYQIHYENTGTLAAENVTITDILPDHEEIFAHTNGGLISHNKILWNLGTVQKGQSGDIFITARLQNSAPDGIHLTNTASIKTSTNEPYQDNNTSSAEIIARNPVQHNSPSGTSSSSTTSSSNSGGSSTNSSGGTVMAAAFIQPKKKTPVKKKVVKKTAKKAKKPVKKVNKKLPPIKKSSFKRVIQKLSPKKLIRKPGSKKKVTIDQRILNVVFQILAASHQLYIVQS